ncbi:hypothetical protein ACFS6H_18820 [Terrimonas rubra]|uniref:Uncharacterized protein n=1 Tax=Terrimonas rubra TaxID=1035890 RepID=A0ABW6A8U4_9BACT
MKHSHKSNIDELVALGIIDEHDTYDYTNNDPYEVVDNYFQFCQTNLNDAGNEYGILPARIYIRRRMDVNAAATKSKEYYVMRVNFGTILTMFRLYTDHHEIFKKKDLSDFNKLNTQLNDTIDYLLFQISTQFTFYHEKAHLIQLSPVRDTWLEEIYENDNPEDEPFSLKRHIYEFDADLHASTFIAFHLLEYWKKQDEKLRDEETLSLIASIGLASVISYFIFLMKDYKKIYYKASTHPHPIIRISYIVDCLVKTLEGNIKQKITIDSKKIVKDAFRLTDILFSFIGKKWVMDFSKLFFEESKNIEDYVNSVLIEGSKSLPELTINRA